MKRYKIISPVLLLKIVNNLGLNFYQEIRRDWDFIMLADSQIGM